MDKPVHWLVSWLLPSCTDWFIRLKKGKSKGEYTLDPGHNLKKSYLAHITLRLAPLSPNFCDSVINHPPSPKTITID